MHSALASQFDDPDVTRQIQGVADTSGASSRKDRARDRVFAPAVTLAWLVRLRWGAFLAQAVTVVVAAVVLGGRLQTPALAILVGLTAASNVALQGWVRAHRLVPERVIGAVFVTDAVLLTALLYFSGGPSNPFSVLYLVYVTLAALALGIGWASAVVGVAATGYALLFFAHVAVEGMDHEHHHDSAAFSIHLQAMWVAFTVTAALIAFFVARLQRALRERDEQLAEAHRIAARNEKLVSLTTLAAGAAHELGTPLATIAVTSKELERAVKAQDDSSLLLEDIHLIREELERCRGIVQQMSGRSGEAMGEGLEAITVQALVQSLRDKVAQPDRLVVSVGEGVPARVLVPVRGLVQSLRNLVGNGLDASAHAEERRIDVRIGVADDSLCFEVEDHGTGFSEEELARAGEPFFSTKPPGNGMGLGLFLAHAFATKWQGRLAINSESGCGTRVRLELPLGRKKSGDDY
jgi:two-component system, sensor histidine kinase RegB